MFLGEAIYSIYKTLGTNIRNEFSLRYTLIVEKKRTMSHYYYIAKALLTSNSCINRGNI